MYRARQLDRGIYQLLFIANRSKLGVHRGALLTATMAVVIAATLLSSAVVQSASAASAMKVTVKEQKDPITKGSTQSITVKATDSKNKPLKDASVSGTILYAATKTVKTFTGKTNASGEFVYSWQIDGNSNSGIFGVEVKATKSGFNTGYASTTFTVMPRK